MFNMFKVLLTTVTLLIFKSFAGDLPAFIHVCKKEDPNLTQCLLSSMEDIRPFLVDGIPEYHIPSLEPLIMQDFFADEAAGMKIKVTNVSAWGCTDYVIKGLDVDLSSHDFTVHISIPKLRIEAHYTVDGKIIVMPVKGSGNLEGNITDVHATAHLLGELYDKDGEEYLRYHSFDLQVDVGGGNIRLENLFNGDKVLLGMINEVLNKNLDMFLKELMPIIQKSLAKNFKQIANGVVENFTYKQLFP